MSFIPGTGNDPVFVSTNKSVVGAGSGNDWYYISETALEAGKTVSVSDVDGVNTIQIPAAFTIVGSRVGADLLELTLSNGAKIQVFGASNFSFVLGGAPLSSVGATQYTFADFVTNALGSTLPAVGDPIVTNTNDVVVNGDGTTTVTPDAGSTTYTLTAAAAAVDEGATATFNLATTNVAAGTEVAYTITGIDAADLASGALTGKAIVAADGTAAIAVSLAADKKTEGAETLTVTLDGKTVTASSTVNDTSMAPTFSLTASAANINEGETNTFTVTASEAVAADTTVTFQLRVDASGDTAQPADFNAGAFNPVTATIKAGQTTATFGLSTITNDGTEVSEKYTVDAAVNGQTLSKQVTILDGGIGGGQTFQLTKGLDSIPGLTGSNGNTSNSGDDTILASVSATNAELNTMSSIDVINGGSGINTLKISAETALTNANLATLSNVQNIEVAASADATVDTSSIAGVTSLKATKAGANLTLKAASTTAIDVSGVTGEGASGSVKEVFVATFAGTEVGSNTTIAFDGVTSTLVAGVGGAAIAAEFVADYNAVGAANWVAVQQGADVSFTAKVAGTKSDVVSANFVVGNSPSGDTTAVTVTAAAPTTQGSGTPVSTATVDGGSSQTVSVAKGAVTVGATTVTTGAISVTNAAQGTDVIAIDGGAAVTVNTTGSTGGAVTVGQGGAAADLATGAVAVTSTQKAVAGTDVTLGAVTVTGGSTVTVAQVSDTSKAATDTGGATVTQGDVSVTGKATTSVTVNQAKSTAEVAAVTAIAGVTETASVKFGALKNGDALTLSTNGDAVADAGELKFTASADMTAAEVAAAFASLINGTIPVAGDTQSGGAASKGIYTGAVSGWTSGAVATDTVVFTSTTANSNIANDLQVVLTDAGAPLSTAAVVTVTNGSSATLAKTGVLGVINGKVTINDNATAAITSVTVDGYAASSAIGSGVNLTKLATLSLANTEHIDRNVDADFADANEQGDMTVNVGAAAATLGLTLNNVTGTVTLTGAALKTLNVTTSTADSTVALGAANVETLTVAGDKLASFTADLAKLKTVTVTGTAGLTLAAASGDTITSITTTGTTGKVTATIDAGHATTSATYTGGAGVDNVTLATTTALTKAIDLGAGDDSLNFGALSVSGSSAAVNGGDGTDTLIMNMAAADNLDAAAQTFYTNFERLSLSNAAGDTTLNLANLGFTNYVTTAGSNGTLTLDKMASNGTVVLTVAPTTGVTVQVKDADTGTADVLNVVAQVVSADIDFKTVTAANVETINLTATDTKLDDDSNGTNDPVELVTMILTADKATSVNLGTSNANLALTLTGSSKVTSIDGSAMTGTLNVKSVNTTAATTVKGGSANDVLTANTTLTTAADILLGGAGDDTLTVNAGLNTLTGGTGNDLFVVATASLNSSSFATITDFAAGDLIKFTGAATFAASKVTQADTAVFQDYANAAMNAIAADSVAWFQFSGNTYVVMDAGAESTTFVNSEDFVVKLTGLVDLTNASFNNTSDTIAL